ncbi:hypothetical protein D3C80_1595950 [compost metagenome]
MSGFIFANDSAIRPNSRSFQMIESDTWIVIKDEVVEHGIDQVSRCSGKYQSDCKQKFGSCTSAPLFYKIVSNRTTGNDSENTQAQFSPNTCSESCAESHSLIFDIQQTKPGTEYIYRRIVIIERCFNPDFSDLINQQDAEYRY